MGKHQFSILETSLFCPPCWKLLTPRHRHRHLDAQSVLAMFHGRFRLQGLSSQIYSVLLESALLLLPPQWPGLARPRPALPYCRHWSNDHRQLISVQCREDLPSRFPVLSFFSGRLGNQAKVRFSENEQTGHTQLGHNSIRRWGIPSNFFVFPLGIPNNDVYRHFCLIWRITTLSRFFKNIHSLN